MALRRAFLVALGAVGLAAPGSAQMVWAPPPGPVVIAPQAVPVFVAPPHGAVPVGFGRRVGPPVYGAYPYRHPYRYRRGPSAGDVLAGALVIGTVAVIAASASQPRRPAAVPPGAPPAPPAPQAPGMPGARLSAIGACAETAEASAGPGARTVSARETGFDRGVSWVEGEVEEGPRSILRFSCGFDGQRITAFRFV
ncbi:MAG: hypothetical protein ACK4MX_07365 [Thermaurantiacus sp.]